LWDYLGIVGDDEDRAEAVSDFIENGCELSDFEEAYQGQFKDEEEFAEQLVDDLGYLNEMPENLRYYFDYEKFARDLFLTDYWMSSNGHVFRNM
jgi:antirestriction protein